MLCGRKKKAPKVNFQLTNEATCIPKQHQDSLLPVARQGEESDETAAKRPALVCIYGVFDTVNIHISDA
ncbi:FlmC family protein [Atlantibacter subterranea]|uniref:DUF5431 family protein n=1 Tax=Atlantibacter subterraneus TaxID=255519 RepID=UPI0020C447BF|nr:DUF5431 family protein [Atlantibacter subterranea]UTJ49576.1 FlmC family protein [Atlantibacter subterranea]